MVPQPRWTVPINMRLQDKPILDAALDIAKRGGSDITTVFRAALAEFVRTRSRVAEGVKLDEFLDDSELSRNPICSRILIQKELKGWSEKSLA